MDNRRDLKVIFSQEIPGKAVHFSDISRILKFPDISRYNIHPGLAGNKSWTKGGFFCCVLFRLSYKIQGNGQQLEDLSFLVLKTHFVSCIRSV